MLLSRCKNRSLLVAKFARNLLQNLLVANGTRYLLEISLVAWCRSCLLQRPLAICCKICSLLVYLLHVTSCKNNLLQNITHHSLWKPAAGNIVYLKLIQLDKTFIFCLLKAVPSQPIWSHSFRTFAIKH